MNCFLCGSNHQTPFARVESFGFPLVYYQCDRCGLIFQSEKENQASDLEFYESTYREIYQASEEPTAKDLWVQEQRAAHLINLLRSQNMANCIRVLDIGASAGVLLNNFRKTTDCDVVGVEPGDAYRAYAEQNGLQMFPSLDALIESTPERFDLVSLIHVLEHLPDPVGTLQTIRKELLVDDGILLLEVPNFYAHDSYELAHLACYTPHTLREVVRQAGFEVISLQCHGVPRSSLLNLYLTLLARPLQDNSQKPLVQPGKNVRFKRQIGFLYRRLVQKVFPRQAWLPLPDGKES